MINQECDTTSIFIWFNLDNLDYGEVDGSRAGHSKRSQNVTQPNLIRYPATRVKSGHDPRWTTQVQHTAVHG